MVEESFGYCKHTTRRISLTDWAKKLNIARSTVIRSFEELERLEFIEKYKSNNITDGGFEYYKLCLHKYQFYFVWFVQTK